MAFHCTNCNGSMVFDIATQLMKCQHCGATCDPKEFAVRDEGVLTCRACGTTVKAAGGHARFCPTCGAPFERTDADDGEGAGAMARFTCQNCGAELEGTEDSMIGFCPYCGGQSMIKERGGAYTVEDIVPFQVDKDRCVELYESYAKGVRYLPKELRDPSFIQKFTGIYMPFFQYDVRFGESKVTGRKTVVSNSRYDEIEHYDIAAEATDDYLRGVTFDGSRYLDDEISDRAQPFDHEHQTSFSPAYLAGFYADSSTVDPAIYERDAEDRAAEDLRLTVAAHVKQERGITVNEGTSGIEAHQIGHHSVLLPLWFLTWRKEDRVAYAVINGESGKVVSDLPLDLRSFGLGCVVFTVVAFLVLELLFQPTPMVTSLLSLAAALLMGHGIRRSAQTEYEKHQHTYDKGWAGKTSDADDGTTQKKRSSGGGPSVSFLIAAYVAIALVGGAIMAGESSSVLTGLRFGLPALTLGFVLFVGWRVLGWRKQTKDQNSLVASIVLLVAVVLNAIIVYVAPVNDGWYYIGDAVCIAGLIAASVGMIRAYNVGTTRPLPKLFDRKDVES